MLLIGNDCITDDEARTQMAIWYGIETGPIASRSLAHILRGTHLHIFFQHQPRSIVAAPLIMGNDIRNISATQRAILLNKDAIAVNQDSLGQQGMLEHGVSTSTTPPTVYFYRTAILK
jgi:hypothetical protein